MQVQQSPYGLTTSILAVSIQHNDRKVTIYLDSVAGAVRVVVDGKETPAFEKIEKTDELGSIISIYQESPQKYVVSASTGVSLVITDGNGTLGAELRLTHEACCLGEAWSGLGGSCTCYQNQSSIPNPQEVQRNDSDVEIASKIFNASITDPDDLLTLNDSVDYIFPGGYAGFSLVLNNTLIYVDYTFIFLRQTITISFHMRFCGPACGGVIFSYSSTTVFLLSVSTYVSVHVDDRTYLTDLSPTASTWTQISMVYDRSSGILKVFLHDSVGIAAWRSIQIDADIFGPTGSCGLGSWLPGSSGSYKDLGSFQGEVDELTIWDRYNLVYIYLMNLEY